MKKHLASVAIIALVLGCNRTAKLVRMEAKPVPITAATLAVQTPCPAEMALVESGQTRVCIDRYEAAIEGVDWSAPSNADPSTFVAKPAKGIEPKVNVSETEAEAACANAGKRLCTATEWVAACRGRDGNDYPYGREYRAGACNEGRPSPVPAASTQRLDDAKLAEVPRGVEPGGTFPQCVTDSGIYDMHGNVHEWVSSSPKPEDPRYGQFHGGFFVDAKNNGAGCSYKTTAHFKTYRDYSIGFRCCADVKGG